MTRVSLFTDGEGSPVGYEVEGHSGFGFKGNDVVCAAVSMLSTNTANSIEVLTEDRPRIEADGSHILCVFDEPPGEKSRILLQSFTLGIRELSRAYGKHVQVKEVRR